MQAGPRKINTPFRPIPLDVPEGRAANEIINRTDNLNELVINIGSFENPDDFLRSRKE